jgi:hypothetical protein
MYGRLPYNVKDRLVSHSCFVSNINPH